MGKEAKTNAMRILERAKVAYTAHEYPHEEGVAVDGVTVAASMGEDPACVYKTLVTQGASRNYFVFVIPVAAELQPGGHEEAVHHRFRRERAEPAEGLRLRRAHRHAGVLRRCRPHQGCTGNDREDHLLKSLSGALRQLSRRESL